MLFLAIVVCLWWYDNLYVFMAMKHTQKSHFGLSTAKGSIKKDGICNI